ncbi:hypothetical protein NDU88_006497 [Pleurodeles waltl]|uniref:Uncharacterized protein n=1 Tax=Pleurodeles waltl TaxID=8319 RepID=A0AAV7TFS2_PLEWA|nr:hypothetical protein NDU88_006497 [Pleurodeles waltl]
MARDQFRGRVGRIASLALQPYGRHRGGAQGLRCRVESGGWSCGLAGAHTKYEREREGRRKRLRPTLVFISLFGVFHLFVL